MTPATRRFADRPALAAALAGAVAAALGEGIAGHGRAALAVPGGSSPGPFFARLREQPVDWRRVTVTLTDERWLPPDHPDSNAARVHRELLRGPAAAARWLPLGPAGPAADPPGEPDPELGLARVAARLSSLPHRLDAVVLGMGTDGHVASLFAGASGLEAALDPGGGARCAAIRPPAAPHPRITLTLALLTGARQLALLITGGEKLEVLERARRPAADPLELPVAAVLRQAQDRLTVYWAP